MGVKFLLDFLENRMVPSAVIQVDLLQVAREFVKNKNAKSDSAAASSKFCLVLDGECCLNRLYGGFFSDWICGGQWNRMADFLDKLISLTETANIELTVFFNGAIESQRMNEWIAQQKCEYEKINKVLAHVAKFGYPPGNKLWIAPVGLRMALRMMLRHKNVNVVSTIDDYRQEVIAYCRENNLHGIITDDAEYIAFDPPRLFSANKFKLKFKGTLESREFVISELMKELQLSNEKLCLLVALLGNYLLSECDLRDVYKKANIDIDLSNETTAAECVVKNLAKYLNNINTSNDLDEMVAQIFGDEKDARGPTLKQSVQYYMDGTKNGFLKYRSVSSGKRDNVGCGSDVAHDQAKNNVQDSDISREPDLDTSKLASENATSEKNLLNTFKEAQSCLNSGGADATPSSTTTTTTMVTEDCSDDVCNSNRDASANVSDSNYDSSVTSTSSETMTSLIPSRSKAPAETKNSRAGAPILPPVPHEVMRTVSERHTKGLMSPYIYQILSQGEIKLPVILEDGGKQIPNVYLFYKPIRQMVYAIVFNLHHHMYMASKNNIAVEVDIRIKEWVFDASAQAHKAEYVNAMPVGWRVPTIQRLWFGTTQDDKRRRLRAFLTCMRSDVQLLLNPEFVPQHLLVAAVVLRYIMSFPEKKILRKPELDAFIVAALSPEFSRPEFIQDVKIPQLSCRGIQLAALFMKGVEMAMLVNDACGAPIPWLMCCPWLFFDGKLFHHVFVKASHVKNLHELCDNRVGLVMRAERMRQAILEGLNVQFARASPLPSTMISSAAVEEFKSAVPYSHPHHYRQQQQQQQQHHYRHHHHHHHQQSQTHSRPSYMSQHRMRMTAVTTSSSSTTSSSTSAVITHSSGTGCGGRSMSALTSGGSGGVNGGRRSLGGRLEIAGVVVGSWGANYNLSQPSYESAAAASTTAAYILATGAQQASAHRSHYQLNKKRPTAKREQQKALPGKGRGLGIVSGDGGLSSSDGNNNNNNNNNNNSNSGSSNCNNNNNNNHHTSANNVNATTKSELPNGVISSAAAMIDASETDYRSGCGGSDTNGTDVDDDRFQDVILNGAVGNGGRGDGDGNAGGIKAKGDEGTETVKSVRDPRSKCSSVEAISK